MQLFTQDASYYAEQIKEGKVTCVELVKQALKNIEGLNPKLNAVISTQEEYALKQAEHYDREMKNKEGLPPFYGVPTLLKDLGQQQEGFPATSGSKLLKDYIAEQTDYFVEKVIRAGFIIIGRTNVPEFGFKGISDAKQTGRVNAPYDLSRNPGGSSGGAAAALKAGIVPLAFASDGGGSIRLPASYSGLIGLKPSRGRVIVGPGGYRGWQGCSVNFALTRSVHDTWTLLKELQTQQLEAPFNIPMIEETSLAELDRPLTIAYSYDSPIGAEVSETSKQNITRTVKILKQLGHKLIEAKPHTDDFKLLKTYYEMNSVETAAVFQEMEEHLGRKLTPDDMEPMTWLIFKAGEKIPAADFSRILAFWDQYTVQREAFISQYDLAITPITDGPAPIHGQFEYGKYEEDMLAAESLSREEQQALIWKDFEKGQDYMAYAFCQNIAGQPAISLPLFETEEGLPLGTHFWAGKGQEYILLQLAKQLEDAGHLKTDLKLSAELSAQ